jgi:hypothetical protein
LKERTQKKQSLGAVAKQLNAARIELIKHWSFQAQQGAVGAPVTAKVGHPDLCKLLCISSEDLKTLRVRDSLATLSKLKRAIPADFRQKGDFKKAYRE